MNEKARVIIQTLEKKYKKKLLFTGDEMKQCTFIPFSSPKLTYLTRGGVARGRMAEFVGAEGSGKTTTALDNLANFQKIDEGLAYYLDAENTLDLDWGRKLGVDWERVIINRPENESAELLLDMVIDIIESGAVGWICIDSIPFLVPKAVIEGSLEDKSYCGNSGTLTQFTNKVIGRLSKRNVTLIMINQLRDKIGSPYVAYNTPGGRALKHAYSQRLFFYKGRFIDENNNELTNSGAVAPAGNIVEVKMEKNKVTKPDRRVGEYTLNYSKGIDILNDTVDLAIMMDVIRQAGAWYYIDEHELKFQGKAGLLNKLNEDAALFGQIYEEVNRKLLN